MLLLAMLRQGLPGNRSFRTSNTVRFSKTRVRSSEVLAAGLTVLNTGSLAVLGGYETTVWFGA